MSLVFEKPQAGVQVDLRGMPFDEAIAFIEGLQATLPPHPSTINLGCGPEPTDLNEEAVRLAASILLAVTPNEPVGEPKIEFATRTGAWFYWRYALALVREDLIKSMGKDAALDLIHSDDRLPLHNLREEKFRWVLKERFGFEFSRSNDPIPA